MFFCKFFSYFTVLLLFVLCCIFSKCVQSKIYESTVQSDKTINIFARESIYSNNNSVGKIIDVNAPFLVAVKNVFVAFSEVNFEKEADKKHNDVLAKYVWAQGNDFVKKITANNGEYWQSQFPFNNKNLANSNVGYLKSPLAVVDDNKIYLLAVKCASTTAANDVTTCNTNLNFVLSVGTVTEDSEDIIGAKIEWNFIESPMLKLTDIAASTLTENILNFEGVSSFLLKGGNVIFVVKSKENDGSKTTYRIVHLKDKQQNKLEVPYVKTLENCHVFFFPWQEKIIMVTQCGDGNTEVTESDDAGKSWKQCLTPLSRLWHKLREEGDFILANIDDKPVLLFTQEENKINGNNNKKRVSLWVSDGTRTKNIGFILNYVGVPYNSGKLLHTKNKLFMICKKKDSSKDNENIIEFASLEEPMEKIMSVLETWNKANNNAVKMCNTQPALCNQSQTLALTNGLVGFLSDSSKNNDYWNDEYLNADAPVLKAEKTTNGFKFTGPRSRAVWPAGAPEIENKVYNFAKSGFTLVATVEINDAGKAVNNSLLGINIIEKNNKQKRLGLWCSDDGNWSVTGENQAEKKVTAIKCKKHKMYVVALQLKERNFAINIDGKFLTGFSEDIIKVEMNDTVSHFYFGAIQTKATENIAESYATVTNVLLYNRPLSNEEVMAVKKIKSADFKKNNEDNTEENNEGNEMHFRPEDNATRVGMTFLIGVWVVAFYWFVKE